MKRTQCAIYIVMCLGYGGYAWADGACYSLKASGPVVATKDNQVIENLRIDATGSEPAVLVEGRSGVVLRNLHITHKAGTGIRFLRAPNIRIENVQIEYTAAPEKGPLKAEYNSISGELSDHATITRVKMEHSSTGIYLVRSPDANLSWIEGYDFRGPFPRGQLVQLNNCNGSSLTDFSVVNDRSKAWTEDNVNIYQSSNVTVKRGLVDGNNSPSGVGVIADNDTHNVLVEDVDALHQGGGCFSANQIDGVPAVTNVTFNRTRCKDNSIDSYAGRGKPGSNGLAWCAEPRTTGIKVLDSIYYNLAVPYNIGWSWNTFEKIEVRQENFMPRAPLGLNFCWQGSGEPATPTSPPPVAGTVSYVSDRVPALAKNGYGPYGKDQSNGEQAAGDGQRLTIGGKGFQKGLGVHADSEMRYDLGGQCATFQAQIGIDDEVGDRGSVVFRVVGDGKALYASPVLTGADGAKDVMVDVTGIKQLALVADAAGDASFDHADWADAKLVCGGDTISASYSLGDVTAKSSKNGWGPAERNQSNGESSAADGRPLTLNRVTFVQGIGVHADSDLRFDLSKRCQTFSAKIGIDDEVGDRGRVRFRVLADNVELYRSPEVGGADAAQSVSLNVKDRSELALIVDSLGDGSFDHADWAEAKVDCTMAPPGAASGAAQTIFVSDLTPTQSSNGWGPVEKDRSNGEKASGDGRTLTLNGKTFGKGLGVHAGSSLQYDLAKRCTRLTAQLGVDDEVGNVGKVQFIVKTDGAEVYRSPVLTGSSATQSLDLNLEGKSGLTLIVDALGDATSDHADWADAKLTCQ